MIDGDNSVLFLSADKWMAMIFAGYYE